MEYQNNALAIWESLFGMNSSDVATAYNTEVAVSYNSIGLAYYRKGDYPKALEYYQKALTIWEETLGPDHQNTQMVKDKISKIQAKMKESEK